MLRRFRMLILPCPLWTSKINFRAGLQSVYMVKVVRTNQLLLVYCIIMCRMEDCFVAHCKRSAVFKALYHTDFHRQGSHVLHRRMNTRCIYKVCMSPAVNGSSVIWCFECSEVFKIHNGIIWFLPGTAANPFQIRHNKEIWHDEVVLIP